MKHEKYMSDILKKIDSNNQLIDERTGLMDYFEQNDISSRARELMNIERNLGHEPLFAFKILVASKLGVLLDGRLNPKVMEYLDNSISLKELVVDLAFLSGFSKDDVKEKLLSIARFGMMEFHPTDICNMKCKGCILSQSPTRDTDKRKFFPYGKVDMFRYLRPKTLIIVGGGEPTLYKDRGHDFKGLLERLVEFLPGIRFGLITNGVYKPDFSEYEKFFDYVRISLGSHTERSYKERKGRNFFKKTLENSLSYIGSNVTHVGFNYMINRNTIASSIEFAKFILNFLKENVPDKIDKCSIQYRAIVYPPNIVKKTGRSLMDDSLDVLPFQINEFYEYIDKIAPSSEEGRFIIENTNLEDCLQGTRSHNPKGFEFCIKPLIFGQIRTNGIVQTCNVRSDDPVVALGNFETIEGLMHMALKQFRVMYKDVGDDLCDSVNCRRHARNRRFLEKQSTIEARAGKIDLLKRESTIMSEFKEYLEKEADYNMFF